MKTAQTIEQQAAVAEPKPQPKKYARGQHPNSRKNLVAPWKPGDCPNPTGINGNDIAKEIAIAMFMQNPELIYKAGVKALAKGNAYAFDVYASRAFGKLKETHEHNISGTLVERLIAGRKRMQKHNG